MVLVSTDERELLLPLYEGVHEAPLWDTFLRRLAARTNADRACLQVWRAGRKDTIALDLAACRGGATLAHGAELVDAGAAPLVTLRPGRVYSLSEMSAPGNGAAGIVRADRADSIGLRDARAVRTPWSGDFSGGLIVLSTRDDFRAADSALLDALVPHISAATATLAALQAAHWRAQQATATLARLGVGQIVFDSESRVVEADQVAEQVLGDRLIPMQRLRLESEPGRRLAEACEALASARDPHPIAIRIDGARGLDLLLRPAYGTAPLAPRVAAIAELRTGGQAEGRDAAQLLRVTYGLSAREAELALAMSRGETISEAGKRLSLTLETARNYSKRIYAKTGARGQADLVRLVLTGLSPLT